MKTFLTLITAVLSIQLSYAQDTLSKELHELCNQQKYQIVIDNYASKTEEISAKSVYYVAMAYYMKADDLNCIKYMDISIEKDPTDSDAYYIKGMTYSYLGEFNKAIIEFNKAIELFASSGEYYTGLADAYYNLNDLDKALENYIKATKQDDSPDRPYTKIAGIYNAKKQNDKAIEAFYTAKGAISKESNAYKNTLFNLGMLEILKGNYGKAEPVLKELVDLDPNDHHAMAKLIQSYYGQKKYIKANDIKDRLYKAFKAGELNEQMKNDFCFDQFMWKDKSIQAFERFAEPEGELYYKHVFYVFNKDGKLDRTIQTENSIMSVELGGPKYLLGMQEGDKHSTLGVGFNEDLNYDKLKEFVIKVLEGKVKASASSVPKE